MLTNCKEQIRLKYLFLTIKNRTILNEIIKKKLSDLFLSWSLENAILIKALPSSGSNRQYYRITGKSHQVVGAFNDNPAENKAFISLSRQFRESGLKVPSVFCVSEDLSCYLIEDLGDEILFDRLAILRQKDGISAEFLDYYKRLLTDLIQFQMVAGKNIDFSSCYPVTEFDGQAYLWDLNYFKYNFLKPLQIPFDEYLLELDFRELSALLMIPENRYFVYRDFQARNVMIKDDTFYFIDFQGGRKGPLHYDLASLLFQARADLPFETREFLLDHYIAKAAAIEPDSIKDFRRQYYHFALIRVLQTLGAYGFRGLFERKQHFLQSIPKAIENVKWLLENDKIPSNLPELKKCLGFLVSNENITDKFSPKLIVEINSFSYKRGIPADLSGNGGGFVFDCRGLPNPGRYEEYKAFTGLDTKVSDYLETFPEVSEFVEGAFRMVQGSIKTYTSRNFSNLMISFGCTGGRHRSVYCAAQLARNLENFPGINLVVRHREQEKI